MMKRKLMSFVSIVQSPPCFVIPIFAVPGSNLACAQDLDAFGFVKRFIPISTENFFEVPILPEKMDAKLGSEGVLAFWQDNQTLFCGTMKELADRIEKIDESTLPAFLAVEALTLVNDQDRLEGAIRRVEPLFSDDRLRKSLRSRVLSRSHTIKDMQINQLKAEELVRSDLAETLSNLEKDLVPEEWIRQWRLAIRRFGFREEIRLIAEWKFRTGTLLSHEGEVLYQIIDFWNSPFRDKEFVGTWLQNKINSDVYWPSVWMRIRDWMSGFVERMNALAEEYLRFKLYSSEKNIDMIDLIVWRRLWRDFYKRNVLAEIVDRHIIGGRYNDSFMEFVGFELFSSDFCTQALEEEVSAWLEQPRSLNTWVFLLIDFSKRYGAERHRDQAMEWLGRLGRGSNQWIKLWQFFKDALEDVVWNRLGIEWLLSARLDLKSWPKVFKLLYDSLDGQPNEALALAASNWLAVNGRKKRNRLIESVAREVHVPRLI